MNTLSQALKYLEFGWSVVPIEGRGKKPLVTWKRYAESRPNPDLVRSWFEDFPDRNIGIVTGEVSGITVLDFDSPDCISRIHEQFGKLPDTPTAITARGRHMIFKYAADLKTRAGILPDLDIRNDGGYIVGAPSWHSTGVQYTWEAQPGYRFGDQIAELPSALRSALSPGVAVRHETNAPVHSPSQALILEGSRNTVLTARAGALAAKGLSKADLILALRALNASCCVPPLPDIEVQTIARSIWLRHNRTLGGSRSPSAQLVTRTLDTVEAETVEWLWKDFVPLGGITIWDGAPGIGKSTLTLDLAARVSTGSEMPDGSPGVTGNVLIFNVEDNIANTVVPRLMAARARMGAIITVDGVPADGDTTRLPTLPDDLALIENAAKECDAKLIIIDPFLAFLSSSVNSWSDQAVRSALAPLSRLAERLQLAVILVRHPTKNREAGPMEAGSGSIGIVASARAAFYIGQAPSGNGDVVIAPVKQNLSRKVTALSFRLTTGFNGAPMIAWQGASDLSAQDLRPRPAESDSRLDEACGFLERELLNGPRSATELADAARAVGISDKTLKRAKSRLGVISTKGAFAGGAWMWVLDNDVSPTLAPFDEETNDTKKVNTIIRAEDAA